MKDFKGIDKQSIFKMVKHAENPESLLVKDICVVRKRSWAEDDIYLATKNIEVAEKFLNEVDGLSSIAYISILHEYTRGRGNEEKVFSERVISFRPILGMWYVRIEDLDIADIAIQINSLLKVAQSYEYVTNKLEANEVLILYRTVDGYKVVHTSLNQLTISNWLNTSSLYEVLQVIKRFDNPSNIAEIVVPNLDSIEASYERINLMDIIEVKRVEV